MKKWMMLLLAALLMLVCACALADKDDCEYCDLCCPRCSPYLADYYNTEDDDEEYAPGWLDFPSEEVLEYLNNKWPEHRMEDYCKISSYSFALLRKGAERTLLVFRLQDGEMKYWFKTKAAVPQGREEAWIDRSEDGRSFTVTRLDGAGESYEQGVTYRLEDGIFKLQRYWFTSATTIYLKDGYLEIVDNTNSKTVGTVKGVVQDDLRYVTLSTLPATLKQAQEKITVAPDLPAAQFAPTEIKFEGGKSYAVYTGPGKEYVRSGNGKGSVSTNDWIQVFGKYGKWILIQYDISAEQYRIGWIEASALPRSADVETLDFEEGFAQTYYQDVVVACELTDDPFNSRKPIAQLEVGQTLCELVYNYEGWSYIVVEVDGKLMCGFVPSECISHG